MTSEGVPAKFYIHAGSEVNSIGLRVVAVSLPKVSVFHTATLTPMQVLQPICA